MRRGLLILLALALLGIGAACTHGQMQEQEGYALYFTASREARHGPAIRSEPWAGGGEDCTPEALIQALLAGPTQEELTSPFPRGVSLISCTQEEGVLTVSLSEQYSGLTDVSLTLADYCIVLTLCQLEGVEAVEIRSPGYSGTYRSHQLLRPEEAELTMPDSVPGTSGA